MATYGRTIARIVLLCLMITVAVLVNANPAGAATCQQTCLAQERACAAVCHNFGPCLSGCLTRYEACLKTCS